MTAESLLRQRFRAARPRPAKAPTVELSDLDQRIQLLDRMIAEATAQRDALVREQQGLDLA